MPNEKLQKVLDAAAAFESALYDAEIDNLEDLMLAGQSLNAAADYMSVRIVELGLKELKEGTDAEEES